MGQEFIGQFNAMGCPCEILVDTRDAAFGERQLEAARTEAARIEQKYSRYISGTIVARINGSHGESVDVDDETAQLLDYAAECWSMSDGLFDITTGTLRKVWRFDGSSITVDERQLQRVRSGVGWEKVQWKRPQIRLAPGAEIDFGGIVKEYAADRILSLLRKRRPLSTLVNLGGDIAAAGTRLWSIGVEDASRPEGIARTVQLREGGVATSGTTRRFVRVNGERLSHILHPRTGWPVKDAPESVTIMARTCTEAGFWSTLAVLQGIGAEEFLENQGMPYWCIRPQPIS